MRPQGFRLYCDHRNLIHVFAPDRTIKKHVRGKLLCWSLKLCEYRYIIQHIEGPKNVWADMISRWGGSHISTERLTTRQRPTAPSSTTTAILRPLDVERFVWPSIIELTAIQQSATTSPPSTVRTGNGLLSIDGKIWVPAEANDFIQRLCVISHCGIQGHRGQTAMTTTLASVFHIVNLKTVVECFLKKCLLCNHVKGGRMVQRPWSETIECNERNGVIHFDFLSLEESYDGNEYLLVIKDHATHFCELVICGKADSAAAVSGLLDWYSRFGFLASTIWVSDNGSHFKNEVMSELSRRMKVKHEFTLAHSPWINGSVERINRDILQVLKAMVLEYKLSFRDWVYLVPMIQSSLNHTPVPSLGNRAPIELFTSLERPTPLMEFYSQRTRSW